MELPTPACSCILAMELNGLASADTTRVASSLVTSHVASRSASVRFQNTTVSYSSSVRSIRDRQMCAALGTARGYGGP
jgi:hypothetical protein